MCQLAIIVQMYVVPNFITFNRNEMKYQDEIGKLQMFWHSDQNKFCHTV